MRAMVIDRFGGPEELHLAEMPTADPGPGEVRVRVVAAGVNPIDCKIRQGYMGGPSVSGAPHRERPHRWPAILGWDASGVIDQVGENADGLSVGDQVLALCLKPEIGTGSYAETVVVRAANVGRKPPDLSHEAAATLPVAGLTAFQAIVERLEVLPQQKVLITAGAGGVGSFAVQLAARAGAHVIATASAANHRYLADLGAAEQIDYRNTDVIDAIRRRHGNTIDAILHCVDGQDVARSVELVRDGGRVVWIVGGKNAHGINRPGVTTSYVGLVRPDSAQLSRLAALLADGSLGVTVSDTMRLADAAEAHRKMETGHIRGKLVLRV